MDKRDKLLGMDRDITRRDFVQGVAVGTAAVVLASCETPTPVEPTPAPSPTPPVPVPEPTPTPVPEPAPPPVPEPPAPFAPELDPSYYPPRVTGLRGQHSGSFEMAHALRDGDRFEIPDEQTDETYDLVIVGGGISGLSAAYFYRQENPGAKILILDNHDDFGGHAKRNEFEVDGRLLIGHGGSQSIESPSDYSSVSKGLIESLGIRLQRFYSAYDQDFRTRNGLRVALSFDAANWGKDRLIVPNFVSAEAREEIATSDLAAYAEQFPYSHRGKVDLIRLLSRTDDPMPGVSIAGKVAAMKGMSYDAYLGDILGMGREVRATLHMASHGEWGRGTDSISALEGLRLGYPGTSRLNIPWSQVPDAGSDEPYIFHFPDGNASVARLLVRDLIPGSMPEGNWESIVLAPCNYAVLDRPENNVRIRLNSICVSVRNKRRGGVDVTYWRGGEAHRVVGRQAIMACYHTMIPHLMPEVPKAQAKAMRYQVKTPLLWANVVLRNWRAIKKLGTYRIYFAGGMFAFAMPDYPVSMGGYDYPDNPDEPMVLYMIAAFLDPGKGLSPQEQNRVGRQRMLEMDFEDFERAIRKQLYSALKDGGFDPARDIAAITVNRWPHGYSYEYNELFDPDWAPGEAPHEIASKRVGRVAMANADATARAYMDGAIDAAWRAVRDLAEG